MALLWCDGFDHYGNDETNLTDGPWAEIGGVHTLSTARPRTGTHSMRYTPTTVGFGIARRVFGAALTTAGASMAFYTPNLPSTNDLMALLRFRDAANADQVSIILQTTGAVAVYRGNASSGTLLATSTDLVTADSWNHLEAKVTIADAGSPGGAVEVRLNNVTIIDISGIDTQNTGNAETSQVCFLGKVSSGLLFGVSAIDWDDVFAWDTSGSQNNDFLGDQQVLTLFPNQDTAQADWTQNTGATEVSAIDEADPDDDTTYVAATAAAQVSEYELDDLPATVSAISAIQLTGRMKKTDAGTARVQQSLVSSAVGSPPAPAEFNGSDRNITTEYTYWPDISETDPATGAPWARAAVNSAKYKIERTA